MEKKTIRTLIAGVGGGSNGSEISKALQSSDLNYSIVCCDMSKQNLYFCKSDKKYVVPPADNPEYISKLCEICGKENVEVIFPGSEPDLKSISENRETFEDMGIFLAINNRELINLCMNKKLTFDYLFNKGIAIPKTVPIDSEKDIKNVDFYPVVIKPYVGSGGSRNSFIAQDAEELSFFCHYMLKYGVKPLIQEYKGSSEDEYTVGVLSGKDGNPISIVAIRRFILSGLSNKCKVQSLHKKGEMLAISTGISQGEIVIDDELNNQCIEIASKLKSQGPINIQCRYVDGIVYPFEINPRFSGTTYMRSLAGINEPDLFIRKHFLNEDIPPVPHPKKGLVLRGLVEKFIEM